MNRAPQSRAASPASRKKTVMTHSPFSRFFGSRLLLAGAALFAAAASPTAFAQADWPQQPVTLIMGFPAGSGVDVVARAIQEPLARQLGKPVIIDYKSGAAGNIASEYVAHAKPDGYT